MFIMIELGVGDNNQTALAWEEDGNRKLLFLCRENEIIIITIKYILLWLPSLIHHSWHKRKKKKAVQNEQNTKVTTARTFGCWSNYLIKSDHRGSR
jgi:hypothetical protein